MPETQSRCKRNAVCSRARSTGEPTGGGPGRRRRRRGAQALVIVAVEHSLAAVRPRIRNDLPRHVVAVLLGVEDAPTVVERLRVLGPEDAAGRWVTVRDVEAGDLVVAVVAEAG